MKCEVVPGTFFKRPSDNNRTYIYAGVHPIGKDRVPNHVFYQPGGETPYFCRNAEMVREMFPGWDGDDA